MRLAYFTFTDKNEVAKMNAIEIGNFPDCNMMLQAANISVPNSEWGIETVCMEGRQAAHYLHSVLARSAKRC